MLCMHNKLKFSSFIQEFGLKLRFSNKQFQTTWRTLSIHISSNH